MSKSFGTLEIIGICLTPTPQHLVTILPSGAFVFLIFHYTKFWQKYCEQLPDNVLSGIILDSKQKPFHFFQALNKLI